LRLAWAKRFRLRGTANRRYGATTAGVVWSKPFPPEASAAADAYGMIESSGNMLNGKRQPNAFKKSTQIA